MIASPGSTQAAKPPLVVPPYRMPYAQLLELSDESILVEISAGNIDAFAVLFKRYHRLVHVIALNILRDGSEAEDITQDVFLEIYRKLGQFDPSRGTVKVWLLQYAYSRSINRRNYLLVRQVHNRIGLEHVDEPESLWSSSRLPVQEAEQLANQALAELPEAQRKTIQMFFFEGLTFKEIALRRSETFSNVRHHYYRGLKRLRSFLQAGPGNEDRGAERNPVRSD